MSAKRFTYIVSCDLFHKLMFESSRVCLWVFSLVSVGVGSGFSEAEFTSHTTLLFPPTGGDKEKKESSCFGGPGCLLLPAAVLLGQI